MKILVVDDHPLVRDAMLHLLAPLDSSVKVLEASDCMGAIALARAQPDIDLVLLDLNLPGIRGFEALDRFRREQPSLPVVILSMHRDRETVLEAIRRGAMGFIPKATAKEVIVSAVRLVLSGGVYFRPKRSLTRSRSIAARQILRALRNLRAHSPDLDSPRVRDKCLHSSCAAAPTRRFAGLSESRSARSRFTSPRSSTH